MKKMASRVSVKIVDKTEDDYNKEAEWDAKPTVGDMIKPSHKRATTASSAIIADFKQKRVSIIDSYVNKVVDKYSDTSSIFSPGKSRGSIKQESDISKLK